MSRHDKGVFETIISGIPKDHNVDKKISEIIARMDRCLCPAGFPPQTLKIFMKMFIFLQVFMVFIGSNCSKFIIWSSFKEIFNWSFLLSS
jgi:hypothetical protein